MAFLEEASLGYSGELSAINDMLAAIGESPVNSLEGDPNADVANCRRILNQVNREVQGRGWTFNIEEGAVLTPDATTGFIQFTNDFLKMSSTGGTPYRVAMAWSMIDWLALTDSLDQ